MLLRGVKQKVGLFRKNKAWRPVLSPNVVYESVKLIQQNSRLENVKLDNSESQMTFENKLKSYTIIMDPTGT